MKKRTKVFPRVRVRVRAVRLVFECRNEHPSQWAAFNSSSVPALELLPFVVGKCPAAVPRSRKKPFDLSQGLDLLEPVTGFEPATH